MRAFLGVFGLLFPGGVRPLKWGWKWGGGEWGYGWEQCRSAGPSRSRVHKNLTQRRHRLHTPTHTPNSNKIRLTDIPSTHPHPHTPPMKLN